MGLVSDVLDAAVEISTGSAELIAAKWTAVAGGVLGLVALLLLVILLLTAPMVGLVLAAVLLGVLWIFAQGDNDLV